MSGAELNEDVHRQLGEHNAFIQTLQGDVAQIKHDVKDILEAINQSKGGWKVMMVMCSIAGAMGAFMTKIISVLWFIPK